MGMLGDLHQNFPAGNCFCPVFTSELTAFMRSVAYS